MTPTLRAVVSALAGLGLLACHATSPFSPDEARTPTPDQRDRPKPPAPPTPAPGGAVSFVALNQARNATISKPAGTQAGDLLISAAFSPNPPAVPAGWTQIGTTTRVGPSDFSHYFAAAWRIAQAGDTSWSWTRSVLTITHAYRNASPTAAIHAFSLARSTAGNPPLGNLTASAAGDAAVYICIGVYHANVHPAPGYTARIDWTADDYGTGDRLNLAANQTTGGNLDTAGDAWNDRAVLHLIVKRR